MLCMYLALLIIIIINYTQLRIRARGTTGPSWGAWGQARNYYNSMSVCIYMYIIIIIILIVILIGSSRLDRN